MLSAFLKRPKLVIALGVNALLMIICSWWLSPAFDSINDDAGMNMIASGFMSGHPNEFLVLMNVFIGQILKVLYLITDAINWYTLFLYAVQYFSLTIIYYAALKQWSTLKASLFFLVFYIVFGLQLFFRIQFTSTGAMAALAGILYLFHVLSLQQKPSRLQMMVIVGSFTTAYLIRYQLFYGTMLFLTPLLVYEFWLSRRKLIVQLWLLLVVIYVPIRMYDKLLYQVEMGSPNFLDFLYSSEVLANDPLDVNKITQLKDFGWGAPEVYSCRNHFWSDEEVFARDKVIKAAKLLASNKSIDDLKADFLGIIAGFKYYLLLALIPLFFIDKKVKIYLQNLAPVLVACGILAILILFARTPYRAVISFVMMGFTCSWWYWFNRISYTKHLTIISYASIIFFFYQFIQHKTEADNYINNQRYILQAFDLDIRNHPSILHVAIAGFYPTNGFLIDKSPTKYLSNNVAITGWCSQSPASKKLYQNWGYKDCMDMALNSKKLAFMGIHYSIAGCLESIALKKTNRPHKFKNIETAATYGNFIPVVFEQN